MHKKKLDSWNEVIDEANEDFYENRKEFWAFVGRTSKGNRKGIVSLKSTSGSCVTSTKGKLEVLQEHYERLGTASVDDQFDDSWKQYVENKVPEYNRSCIDNIFTLNEVIQGRMREGKHTYAFFLGCSKSI